MKRVNDTLEFDPYHDYYYQVQGHMLCTERYYLYTERHSNDENTQKLQCHCKHSQEIDKILLFLLHKDVSNRFCYQQIKSMLPIINSQFFYSNKKILRKFKNYVLPKIAHGKTSISCSLANFDKVELNGPLNVLKVFAYYISVTICITLLEKILSLKTIFLTTHFFFIK